MKRCSQCKTTKPLTEFFKGKNHKDGLQYICKKCTFQQNKAYRHTKHGLISRIFNTQRVNSLKRNHPQPTYTKQELQEWVFNQKLFNTLYNNWADSGFLRSLIPSCDRTNNHLGYSLDRLQLKTWQENNDKGNLDRKNGISITSQMKAVSQFTKEGKFIKEYYSINEAQRQTGTNSVGITLCCKKVLKAAGGFNWEYKIIEVKTK